MKKFSLSAKFTAVFCIILLLVPTFSSCTDKNFEKTSFAMGSVLSVKTYTDDNTQAEEIFTLINDAVSMADKALSNTDEEAEVYKLNKDKIITPTKYFENVLSDTILICNILDRRVNVSIGKVTSLWGFNTENPHLPDAAELEAAVNGINLESVVISSESSTVSIGSETELDMGAFGKGAACDAAFNAVYAKHIPLIMTLGGTVMAYGHGPSDGWWTIGVRNPFGDSNSHFATLKLFPDDVSNAAFVSTSGNYEKTFTENGKTYHHILDPKTGYPVENDLVSVTVIANSGLNADALSTALFINGINEKAKSDIEIFGCEAIFVTKDKICYITDGLTDVFEITDKSFTVKNINEYTE